MFQWVLLLEQERANLLDNRNLSIHQNELVEHVLTNITGNKKLLEKWNKLFSTEQVFLSSTTTENVVQKLIEELFKQIIMRYVKMGVGEFLREFRRDFEVRKTEAHRKKIVEKQKKKI